MKRNESTFSAPLRLFFAGTLLLALLLTVGCRRPQPASVRVLCGSSMAAPMKELAQEFTQKNGVVVEFDMGGSETLLPKIEAGAVGDIFVCHDPFEKKIKEAKRWENAVAVGYLQPVLIVPPGNPKSVRTIADLSRPGLKIGIGDPRYSTCGELFMNALEQRGVREKVLPQIALQARSPSDAANGLLVGSLDVAVVWNFSAALYAGKVDVVDLGIAYPDVRVTIIGLTKCQNAVQRDAFLKWCSRPEALQVFRKHGYTKSVIAAESPSTSK